MDKRGVIVTKVWLAELEKVANKIMELRPQLREDWLDQCRTSEASRIDGGMLEFHHEHDWVLAFFVWYEDGKPDKEFRE